MKKKEVIQIRLSTTDKDIIRKASIKKDISMSTLIVTGAVREAKRILSKKETVSNCCNAPIIEETDLCSDCKEHCKKIKG